MLGSDVQEVRRTSRFIELSVVIYDCCEERRVTTTVHDSLSDMTDAQPLMTTAAAALSGTADGTAHDPMLPGQLQIYRKMGYESRYFLVHGQVTIIFVVSVCLFVCLFVQFFSAVFDPISIKLGHMLYV